MSATRTSIPHVFDRFAVGRSMALCGVTRCEHDGDDVVMTMVDRFAGPRPVIRRYRLGTVTPAWRATVLAMADADTGRPSGTSTSWEPPTITPTAVKVGTYRGTVYGHRPDHATFGVDRDGYVSPVYAGDRGVYHRGCGAWHGGNVR